MDEKNEKLQPQTIPPEEPAGQPLQEAPDEKQASAPEKAPEVVPEKAAPKQSASAAVSQETQVFRPIRETAPKAADAAIPFAAVEAIPKYAPEASQKAAEATVASPAPEAIPKNAPEASQKASEVSYFDGSTWAYLGWWALGALITVATLGIGLAWAQCLFWRYRAKHTVVCGRRLTFDGTGLQLFENYLVWGVLTVITLGIYGLWVPFKVRSWYCGHLFMTGYRRRHSAAKAPKWRSVLTFLAALLCFALILTGIIIVATGNAPWQKAGKDDPQPPPPSSSMKETAPDTTPPTTPPTTPETTPEPTTPPVTTPEPTQPPQKTYTVTANSGLLLRSAPSRSGKELTLIPKGTVVTAQEESSGWVKVTYGGYTGWCSGDWLRENNG